MTHIGPVRYRADVLVRRLRVGLFGFLAAIGCSKLSETAKGGAPDSTVVTPIAPRLDAIVATPPRQPSHNGGGQGGGAATEDGPPDGQILRDAGNSVSIEERRYGNMGPLKIVRIRSKHVDQYERDECNTVTEGRIEGMKVLIFAVYSRMDGFWKLRHQQVRTATGLHGL